MFITFEGIEGAGKSTILSRTAEWLKGLGYGTLETHEPGGSDLGRSLREELLGLKGNALCPKAELFLYLADRAQHIHEVIRPALNHGKAALCDRFMDSTLAYQGYGRGLDLDLLHRLNSWATGGIRPDLTLVLDLPPEKGLARARKRNQNQNLTDKEGRFEAESLEFHRRVREGYLALHREDPGRIVLVNAAAGPEEVFDEVREKVSRAFSL